MDLDVVIFIIFLGFMFFRVINLTLVEWLILVGAIMLAIGLAKVITYYIDKNLPLSEKDY